MQSLGVGLCPPPGVCLAAPRAAHCQPEQEGVLAAEVPTLETLPSAPTTDIAIQSQVQQGKPSASHSTPLLCHHRARAEADRLIITESICSKSG